MFCFVLFCFVLSVYEMIPHVFLDVVCMLTCHLLMMNLIVQMKTGCVALVLCLNISVDPPDVIKISPCARMECWIGKCLFECTPNFLLAEEKKYSYLYLINLFRL